MYPSEPNQTLKYGGAVDSRLNLAIDTSLNFDSTAIVTPRCLCKVSGTKQSQVEARVR
jgi:hypothetical protein